MRAAGSRGRGLLWRVGYRVCVWCGWVGSKLACVGASPLASRKVNHGSGDEEQLED